MIMTTAAPRKRKQTAREQQMRNALALSGLEQETVAKLVSRLLGRTITRQAISGILIEEYASEPVLKAMRQVISETIAKRVENKQIAAVDIPATVECFEPPRWRSRARVVRDE